LARSFFLAARASSRLGIPSEQRNMFQKLYRWTLSLAKSRHAPLALGAIAFAESSFFPVPPDVILIPMSIARPKSAWVYALICTVGSVAGGLLGYAIGALLFETVGKWLIEFYHLGARFEELRLSSQQWFWAVILLKGLTPIPFKLVTITSGLLAYSLPIFIILSIITRGARFFALALLLQRYGEPINRLLDKYFAWFLIGLVLIVIVGFWLAARVL
jgi:membrane protein YqaA with SNARE-associated domain